MNLQDIRKAKGITQQELADSANVPQSYICALEKGRKKNPSVWVVVKIAQTLDTTVDEIVKTLGKAVNEGAGFPQ